MGVFGGPKKKVPNSRKKKGGVARPPPKPVVNVTSAASVKTSSTTDSPVSSVTTVDPPIPQTSSSPPSVSVSERAKAFNSFGQKPATETKPAPAPIVTHKKAQQATANAKSEEEKKTKPKLGLFGKSSNSAEKPPESPKKEKPKLGLFGKSSGNNAKPAPSEIQEESKKAKPKLGLFGKNKETSEKAPESSPATASKPKLGLFKSKATTNNDPPEPAKESAIQQAESPKDTKKAKFGLFGKGKDKSKEAEPPKESTTTVEAPSNTTNKENNNGTPKVGKLSMNRINTLKIPGLGGPRGTSTSKEISGKPPPQIDIYADSVQNPDQQGHAGMSDKAKETLVAPKDAGKDDWKFLYELATQYDNYKLQEAEAIKNPNKIKTSSAKKQQSPPSAPVPGDAKSIKNSLEGVFGAATAANGMSYTANGNFLNNKYFDQYLVQHSSGVALEFSNETSLFKRFCRKDQEQRTICEKFVATLLKHPKSKKITQLNMSSALVPDSFLVALCDQCIASGGLPLLQVLNLESNDLGRDGIEALSKIIAHPKGWRRLQILKLENQKRDISAGAEEVLGDAIVQSSSLVAVGLRMKGGIPKQQVANTIQANLDKLRVARRQHAAKKGTLKARKRNEMESLFDSIAANSDKKITEVDLTDNLRFLGLDATERTKTGAAFATNKTVQKVTMTKLKLDDDFAEAFGKALVKNKTLETVVLDSNSFSAKGIKALLGGLGQNQSVSNFQIRHQSKTMASADEECLLALLQKNKTLVNLGTDVRNPLVKTQLDRKMNENREHQRKQRNAQKKR